MQYILVEIIGTKLQPFTYYATQNIELYDIVEITFRNRKTHGIVVANEQPKEYDFTIYEAQKSQYSLTSLQKTLLYFISSYYMDQIGRTTQIFTLSHTVESKYIQKPSVTNLKQLSQEQQKIFQACQEQPISLIYGVTGSGKTEIYFHAIKKCIEAGKQALFLMPEISLTPQIQKRLDEAFPNQSDIWHSKRTPKQKQKILQSLQEGTITIIAGARSALFLPYTNLGLIIVDEEHDDSYKSNAHPKYNARDLALYLGNKNIQIILGSATPSVKSYYLAKKNNYLLTLKNNFYHTSQTFHYDTTHQVGITENILSALKETYQKRKQTIIFIPTRANFKILLCKTCNNKIQCPNCSITLSVHQKKQAMICHYCNFTQKIPSYCPICNNDELSGIRIGTEEFKKQLEDSLKQYNLYPNIALFDRDNITTQNKLEKTFEAFRNHEIDILIGTQMIAKGHDYHNVHLSIIIGMDYMLNIPNYRSYEIGFALLYQVAGRSGRKEDGKILIQTKDPDSIYQLWGDYTKVLEHELIERNHLYPPFYRLALITFGHTKAQEAKMLAENFANILFHLQTLQELPYTIRNFEIIGICEASIAKVKKKFYYQVLLRSNENLTLQKILKESFKYSSKEILQYIDIDIDPLAT